MGSEEENRRVVEAAIQQELDEKDRTIMELGETIRKARERIRRIEAKYTELVDFIKKVGFEV